MSKRRMLDGKIRTSQSFTALNYRQRDLWHGLIVEADDQGRMPGRVRYVRSRIWPDDHISDRVIERDLEALEEAGNIVRYQCAGHDFIQIVNWWHYQQMQWAMPSECPAPAGWVDRQRYHTTGNKIVTDSWDKVGGFGSPPVSNVPSGLPSPLPSGIDDVKSKEEVESSKDDNNGGAEVPAPTPTPAPPKREKNYTVGQRMFLEAFGAQRFKTTIQGDAVLELEKQYGTARLKECVEWAATRGMGVGEAVGAIQTAIKKWGKPRAKGANGNAPAGKYDGMLEYLEGLEHGDKK